MMWTEEYVNALWQERDEYKAKYEKYKKALESIASSVIKDRVEWVMDNAAAYEIAKEALEGDTPLQAKED